MSEGRRLTPRHQPGATVTQGPALPYEYERAKLTSRGGPHRTGGAHVDLSEHSLEGTLNLHQFSTAKPTSNIHGIVELGHRVARGESLSAATSSTAKHREDLIHTAQALRRATEAVA